MVRPDLALNLEGRLPCCSLGKVPPRETKVFKSGLTIFNKLVSMGLKSSLSWRVTDVFDLGPEHAQDRQSGSLLPHFSVWSHSNSATYR